MSKPMIITEEVLEEVRRDFEIALRNSKMTDGKFVFSKSFEDTNQKAVIRFTAEAYAKMISLVLSNGKEVAWHFVTARSDEENEYIISDVLVYPQTVTNVTVDMDVEEYAKWKSAGLMSGDARFYNLHGQGHSHVSLSTSPSTEDIKHQKQIVDGMRGYYIFVIWNKRNEHYAKIFDIDRNVIFEDADISIEIDGISEIMDDCKAMVKTAVPVAVKKEQYPAKKKVSVKQASYTSALNRYDDEKYADIYDPFYSCDYYFGTEE